MGKLSSAIVQRKLASLRDVEEALARQVLYGGDLATNLLEQAPGVDERALIDLLAEVHGLPSTSPGVIPPSPEDARLLVPGDVALRYTLYPLSHQNGTLVVAVAEPLAQDVEQDLSFALGVTLVQKVAPLVRVRQAIGRDYGMPLDRRSVRVLAKLEGLPDPSPSVAPAPLASAPDLTAFPRPPSIPPLGLPAPMDMSPLYPAERTGPASVRPEPPAPAPRSVPPVTILPIASVGIPKAAPAPIIAEAPPPDETPIHERVTAPAPAVEPVKTEETAPLPVGAAAAAEAAPPEKAAPAPALAPPASRRAGSGQHVLAFRNLATWGAESKEAERKRARGRRRGPYTAASAESDLLAAEGRDDVLSAFFGFASQYFEYSALFAVHGDLAEGRDASGPGADRGAVTGIGVPLDMPSALRTVRNEGRFSIAALGDEGLDGRLAKDLGRPHGRKALFLPILVRERCVLIFYGDDGEDEVELSDVGDVIAFAPLVATALENVIVKKKTAVRRAVADDGDARPPSVRPQPRTRAPLPPREMRVEALAEALHSTVRPVIPSEPPPVRSIPSNPPPARSLPSEPPVPPTVPSAPEAANAGRDDPARAQTPAQGTPARASTPPPPPEGTPVFSLSRKSSSLEAAAELGQSPPPARTESAKTNPGIPRPSFHAPVVAPPPLPATARKRAGVDEAPEISVGTAEVDWADEEGIPNSQVVVPAQLPIKRYKSEELRLPSVIVNVDHDLKGLIARALEGDDAAVDRLGGLGLSAASQLVAQFPGPTKPDSDRLGAPEPASARGPILRALAKIGSAAVPFVVTRSNDSDAGVRALATLLLGELPSEDSAQAVARRVTDTAAEVRRMALEAGRLLQKDEEARTLLRDRVCSIAEESTADIETRVAALEALSHFRDPRAVPRLVRLLPKNDEVGQSAEWALSVITRQAFGRDTAAWEAWWAEHGDQHRIVWLIDALMHDDPEIRRAAGEELKALTKEYFGYYDDLSKSERQKAQRRYREWWESTGKARFKG